MVETSSAPENASSVVTERKPLSELPRFDGRSFNLYYFPDGVQLHTRTSHLRREDLDVPFPASRVRELNAEEKAFGNRKGLNTMRSPGYKPLDESDTRIPSFSPRVNLHNIEYEVVNGQPMVSFDTSPTSFAMGSDKDTISDTKAAERFSFTGAAIALTTQEPDGLNNVVLGLRSEKNKNYPSMAGAAAAGTPVGEFAPKYTRPHEARGRLLPVDGAFFTRKLMKELHEEINLTADQLIGGEPQPIALIWDNVQPHREIGFIARYSGSTEDLYKAVAENDETDRAEFDFAEDAFVLKGGVQPLREFLTESLSPLPPTHQGLYTALLIQMMNKEYIDDPKRLEEEIQRLEKDMQQHSEKIDNRVAEFYRNNPEKAEEAKAKGWDMEGYDYRVGVVQQGLNDPREWARSKGYLVEPKPNEPQK